MRSHPSPFHLKAIADEQPFQPAARVTGLIGRERRGLRASPYGVIDEDRSRGDILDRSSQCHRR